MKSTDIRAQIVRRFRWSAHNIVAHPLSEVLHLLGLARASVWVHDATVPRARP